MLQYLLLKDESLVLILPSGPLTLPRYAINYNIILKQLQAGAEYCDIEHLLNPETPNGIYKAYTDHSNLFVIHLRPDYTVHTYMAQLPHMTYSGYIGTFQGSFTSEADLINSFPEYFI